MPARRRARPSNTAPASSSATTGDFADRQVTDSCLAIAIAGHGNADRLAEDKDHDLALLRIYGARGLKPLNLANGPAKSDVELTGIADPQNQGGGAAVSSVKATVTPIGSDSATVAGAGAGIFRRRGDRRRRKIRWRRAVEAGGSGRIGHLRRRCAGISRYRARFSEGQWRQCGRRIDGRQGVGGARDLRTEVIQTTPALPLPSRCVRLGHVAPRSHAASALPRQAFGEVTRFSRGAVRRQTSPVAS